MKIKLSNSLLYMACALLLVALEGCTTISVGEFKKADGTAMGGCETAGPTDPSAPSADKDPCAFLDNYPDGWVPEYTGIPVQPGQSITATAKFSFLGLAPDLTSTTTVVCPASCDNGAFPNLLLSLASSVMDSTLSCTCPATNTTTTTTTSTTPSNGDPHGGTHAVTTNAVSGSTIVPPPTCVPSFLNGYHC